MASIEETRLIDGSIDKVLLIEASGMTFRCDPVPSDIRESTDKIGMMILKGVPATILDRENGNGRRYTTQEMRKAIRKAREAGLFENRRLLCTATIIQRSRSRLLSILHTLLLMLTRRQSAMTSC